jgi:DNA-binding transcriptional MerR regulator
MTYTVKQLARLAGVSGRTLRFYDQIGLFKPSSHGDNGYRYYGDEAILRLQQIRFYRELDFSLDEIGAILSRPDFDVAQALQAHRLALQQRAARLDLLIQTVDKTIRHLRGEITMDSQELFAGFDDETQRRYEQEAERRWGAYHVRESRRRWDSYSAEEKARIMAEAGANYRDLIPYIGQDPARKEVQVIIARWHQNLRCFYEPTPQILAGLGQTYSSDPEFRATFTKTHPDLPDFLTRAIEVYCQNLTAEKQGKP